ncbi:MAG: type II toxin-antitoxin system HicB family antitoxin [Beijerinckiaceae bacterium]|nr:type II toxin-antitoxin system HicB family antitoxin [Beijerinckiaceae bacterium]
MILSHEGYLAEVTYQDGDALMHGRVMNTRAVLHFAGKTIAELKEAFAGTVTDYRAWCAEQGVAPEKPYSGTLSLRIGNELHRRLASQAAKEGMSLNQFITEQLEKVRPPHEAAAIKRTRRPPQRPPRSRQSRKMAS